MKKPLKIKINTLLESNIPGTLWYQNPLFEFYQSPENPVAPNVELGLAVSTIMLAFGFSK